MMPQLHETMYGKRFFDSQLPALIKALERIAKALEKQEEKERKQVICKERGSIRKSFTMGK